jgi:hypothetical protein
MRRVEHDRPTVQGAAAALGGLLQARAHFGEVRSSGGVLGGHRGGRWGSTRS